jgi:hypothetical protein
MPAVIKDSARRSGMVPADIIKFSKDANADLRRIGRRAQR